MSVDDLPALNAILNGSSAVLLAAGYRFIRARRVPAHRLCMGAAFLLSVAFLTSYVVYHIHHGSTPFPGRGWMRRVYYTVLVTHVSLAAAVLPLSLLTLYRALRGRFERHRRIARWTLPIWLYVSVTGVWVYWVLYW